VSANEGNSSTYTVTVEKNDNYYIWMSYQNGEDTIYLPVGEEVEVPIGTNLYINRDSEYDTSKYKGITILANGKEYNLGSTIAVDTDHFNMKFSISTMNDVITSVTEDTSKGKWILRVSHDGVINDAESYFEYSILEVSSNIDSSVTMADFEVNEGILSTTRVLNNGRYNVV